MSEDITLVFAEGTSTAAPSSTDPLVVGTATNGTTHAINQNFLSSIGSGQKNNTSASADPVATDDGPDGGYSVGSFWYNTTSDKAFVCIDSTNDAAIWLPIENNKYNSTTSDPTTTDDTAAGYAVNSLWVNTSTDQAFICVDATNSAAVWKRIDNFKFNSTSSDPTTSSDAAAGYEVGSIWVNTTDDTSFICVDSTNSAAVWNEIGLQSAIDTNTTNISTNTSNISTNATNITLKVAKAGDTMTGALGIGASANAATLLDVTSTSLGTRPYPTMTTAQRDAIGSPVEGLLIFNSDTAKVNVYSNSAWGELSGSGTGDAFAITILDPDSFVAITDLDLTGQNASFDGGGTITASSLSLNTTLANLIKNDSVILYDPNANGQNDYFGYTFAVPQGLRGRFLGFAFEYKNDSTTVDDDFRFAVKIKDGASAGTIEYTNLIAQYNSNNTSKDMRVSFYCPADCTEIEAGFQNTVTTTTIQIAVDNWLFTSNPHVIVDTNERVVTTNKLTADVTTNTTVSDLTFSNLIIGDKYTVLLQTSIILSAADTVIVDIYHDSAIIGRSVVGSSSSVGLHINEGITADFTATATTLTFVTSSFTAGTLLGNNTFEETHAQLIHHKENQQVVAYTAKSTIDDYVYASNNGGGSVTALTTNIDFTEVEDATGIWNGTTFTPNETDVYTLRGCIRSTSTNNLPVLLYINGTIDETIGQFANDTRGYFTVTREFTAGTSYTIRTEASFTLGANATQHYLYIYRRGKGNLFGIPTWLTPIEVTNKTTTYTAIATDETILADTSGGSWTLTLYSAIGNNGRKISVKKTTSDTNILTIDANGSETIDGSTTHEIVNQYRSVDLISDGSNWNIIRENPGKHSLIRLRTANGYGSTNTYIMRFTNTVTNTGNAITYADSSTEGASFTINENGYYSVSFAGHANSGGSNADQYIGVTLNTANGAASILTTRSEILCMDSCGYEAGEYVASSSFTGFLNRGDVLRPHVNNIGAAMTEDNVIFSISKIGNV